MKKQLFLLTVSMFAWLASLQGQQAKTTFLVEHFTASSCGPCVGMNNVITPYYQEQSAAGRLIYIKYHTSFPGDGDPYYVSADAGARTNYYAVGSAPYIVSNGNRIGGNPAQPARDTLTKRVNAFEGTKSFYNITFDSAHISQVGGGARNLYIRYTITPEVTAEVTVQTVVFESKTYDNASTNGETEFSNVVVKMFPSGSGNVKLMEKDVAYTFVYEHDMNNTFAERIDDLNLVVFVQNDGTKEVLAASQHRIEHSPVVAIPEINFERVGDSALVSLTCATDGTTLYYSLTSKPTTDSTVYTEPFWINVNTTVKAIAADGVAANSYTKTERFEFVVESPKITFVLVENGAEVTITGSTEGSTIHYTVNGVDPTASSQIYTAPFVRTTTTPVRAIGVKTGWTNSPIASVYVQTTSNKDLEKLSLLKIHPNPTNDYVNIEYPETAQLFLYNINGVLVYEATMKGHKQLSMTEFPNGIYILRVSSEQGTTSARIIKQ
jgi:hypothetical protein